MKKILLFAAAMVIGNALVAQVINTFPHTEDFESQATGPTGCGPTFVFSGNTWRNGDNAVPADATHQLDWTVDVGGTGSSSTGPSIDHTLGNASGKYIYTEASCSGTGFPSKISSLISPYYDFTAMSGPFMEFWYHMYGSTMGMMHVDVDTTQGSGAWVQDVVPAWTDNVDLWQKKSVSLASFAGLDSVRIRIRMVSGTNFYSDAALDDITIFEPLPFDLQMLAVNSPQTACGLGMETVTIQLLNKGTDTIQPGMVIPVAYQLDTTIVWDSIVVASNYLPGDTITFSFATQADLSTPGTYSLCTYSSWTPDSSTGNDTLCISVTHIPLISSFPYFENFESGQGGWQVGGTTTTWAFGTPAKTVITGAASGDSAWVTGGLGAGSYLNNENGYVESPCIDMLSSPANPWVAVKVWWNSEFSWDGANLTYSTDGGATWNLVGNYLDPNFWYTDNSINGNPGGYQEGWSGRTSSSNGSGGWVQAAHALPLSLVGQSGVIFRVNFGTDGSVTDNGFAFDDFGIGELPVVNLGNDTTVCGGYMLDATQSIAATYSWTVMDTLTDTTNYSSSSITLYNTGSAPDTLGIVVTATNYLGLSASDTVTVIVQPTPFIELMNDTTICYNDSIQIMIDSSSSSSITYSWSTGATNQMIWANSAGVYALTVQDSLGGCTFSDSTEIMQTAPVALSADTSICPGDTIWLSINIAADSIRWSNGDSTTMTAVTMGGQYVVEVWDSLGCYSTDTISIQQDSVPVAMFNFAVGGAGLTYNFTDISTGGPSSWNWDFGDGNNSGTQNPSHTYATSGSYNVTLIVTNACGADTFVQNITVTGVTETLGEGQVGIYPNPNTGQFDVVIEHISDEAEIVITDMLGHVVYHRIQHGSGKTEVSLAGEAKGIYFVRVRTGADQVIKKVVVE